MQSDVSGGSGRDELEIFPHKSPGQSNALPPPSVSYDTSKVGRDVQPNVLAVGHASSDTTAIKPRTIRTGSSPPAGRSGPLGRTGGAARGGRNETKNGPRHIDFPAGAVAPQRAGFEPQGGKTPAGGRPTRGCFSCWRS